jgi:hypothetical protein
VTRKSFRAKKGTVGVVCSVRIEEILKWTKEHLDAYLASADVIIEQRDEPG